MQRVKKNPLSIAPNPFLLPSICNVWFNAFTARPRALSPEGLLIHSICQIYIFGVFVRCSPGNQSKSGEKQMFYNKVIMVAWTANDLPRDACTDEQATWQIICNVYFMGDWTLRYLQGCSTLISKSSSYLSYNKVALLTIKLCYWQ